MLARHISKRKVQAPGFKVGRIEIKYRRGFAIDSLNAVKQFLLKFIAAKDLQGRIVEPLLKHDVTCTLFIATRYELK